MPWFYYVSWPSSLSKEWAVHQNPPCPPPPPPPLPGNSITRTNLFESLSHSMELELFFFLAFCAVFVSQIVLWYLFSGTYGRYGICFRPQSYVTTRFMLCFSAWQCAFMCIFPPHLSRGSTGWVGVGGGGGGGLIAFCRLLPVASSFRHAPDVTLYRSSLAILDTLPMLRSIDLLLQSSTRSWCYAL